MLLWEYVNTPVLKLYYFIIKYGITLQIVIFLSATARVCVCV